MRIESEYKKTQNTAYNAYNNYKNKLEKNRQQTILMFMSIFIVLLLVFLGFAKLMSPDVDISIGDENTQSQSEDADEIYLSGIDRRLKQLQMEDDRTDLTSEELMTEDDGIVQIPEKSERETAALTKDEDSVVHEEPVKDAQEAPKGDEPEVITLPQNNITYRVVVGMYSTPAQADVAKGILQDAGLGIAPVVRQMAGGYTLQVGAYSSKESANNLTNKLLMNNYPARIITD